MKLSVVLATWNEEKNIGSCLASIKDIADEIIVFDEESTDKTREIAEKYGAKISVVKHEPIFHKTKQKALDLATGEWILQLDADERVTPKLAEEIKEVIGLTNEDLLVRKPQDVKQAKLFQRHQRLIEAREGSLGKKTGEAMPAGRQVVAFFVPRRNFFLGEPLIHAGVYPDGVIRLVKKGKARFPAKSVHELMEVDGEVRWLFNDLEHHDSPTFQRYLDRMNRYTDLTADEYKKKNTSVGVPTLLYFAFVKPALVFLNLYIRHKGFLDGMRGFIWSAFSALHFPLAYFKYYSSTKNNTYPS